MYSHDEYKELTIAHALDALEAAETREVKTHLATCAECRAEFDSWKQTASSLAYVAEPAAPSPVVGTRILEQARELSRTSPETIASDTPSKPSNVIPMRRSWSAGQLFGAIAASLLVALLLGIVVVMWQRNKTLEAEMARLSTQVNESQREIALLREEKGTITGPNSRMTSLAGTEMAKDARAMIAYDRSTGRAMLVANGLPPAPDGQAYQLWFIPKGKLPMPGKVFSTDQTGHGVLSDVVPPEGRGDAVFAVTLERAGGVPAPQGKIFLQGNAS